MERDRRPAGSVPFPGARKVRIFYRGSTSGSRPRKKVELRPFLPQKGTKGPECSAGPVARPEEFSEEFSRLRKVEPFGPYSFFQNEPTNGVRVESAMAGGGHRSFGVGKWGGGGQAREARRNALNRTEGGGVPGTGAGGWGVFRVKEHPNLRILARQNPRPFLKMSGQVTRGWHKLLMRNRGRLLLFPGGLSRCMNQHSCPHPSECRGNTTNEGTPRQHFCDSHGQPNHHSPNPLA